MEPILKKTSYLLIHFIKNHRKLSLLLISITSIFLSYLFYSVYVKSYDVTVVGNVRKADGIGSQSINLIQALKGHLSINFIKTSKPDTTEIPLDIMKVLKLTNNKVSPFLIFEDGLVHDSFDELLKRLSKKNKWINVNASERNDQIWIAYTMVEGSLAYPRHVERINKYFDMAVVPDKFLEKVFKDSGVKVPIFTVPLLIDYKSHLKTKLKAKANKVFVFTNLSSIDYRKNQLKLVKAFHRAFMNRQDVRLRINGRFNDHFALELTDTLRYIHDNNISNVHITVRKLSTIEYNRLLDETDCLVSASVGEGFSIIPREAMARGIPVIVSDNTAQSTIASSGFAESVKSDILIPGYYPYLDDYPIGNMYDLKVEDLAQGLLNVYNNYEEYLRNAEGARKWAEKYSFESLAPMYLGIFKPKKVILGDKNEITPEYLMTNSRVLFDKYNNLLGK